MTIDDSFKFGGYKGFFDSYSKQLLQEQKANPSESGSYKPLSYTESSNKIIMLDNQIEVRLAILTPAKTVPPDKADVKIVNYTNSVSIVRRLLLQMFNLDDLIAVDIETMGLRAHDLNIAIVGVGMASHRSIVYFDFATNSDEVNKHILNWLAKPSLRLIGHNIFFDSAFLLRDSGLRYNWVYDTQGMYKQLANEGYRGQSWGLKNAQVQLLGWEAKGDVELDKWLVRNHHITSGYKKDATYEELYQQFLTGGIHVDKGKMGLAPSEILGYYCGLDCASTYQLLTEVLLPSTKDKSWESSFLDYHNLFLENIQMLVEQQLSGITVDKPALEQYSTVLDTKIVIAETEFVTQSDIEPLLIEFDQLEIGKIKKTEPVKHKKLPKIGKMPSQYNKDGSLSKNYTRWNVRKQSIQAYDIDSTENISKNWIKWQERVTEAEKKNHFNLNSPHHLSWLFYDKLQLPIKIRTETGIPSTGVKALPGFKQYGKLLKNIKDLVKEESYVQSCLTHLQTDIEGRTRIHPQFRVPGTLTCRLAGSGGINIQQLPKSRGYLDCWKPRPGYAWVDCDHSALEQVVLAELSRDASLWKIYGPGAKSNDIYLFNGSQLPGIGDEIRGAGYDPDNPDSETIKRVKKECKKQRGIAKTITLGSSYGMGAVKLKDSLEIQGINISINQAKAMHRDYWKLYKGVKEYEKFLLEEYKINNGWVLNGIGRPVGCAEDYIKDIVNRVVQSTGHDLHMFYMDILNYLFTENKLDVKGIVWDFHDQSIVECPIEQAPLVKQLMEREAYQILNNNVLQGKIDLKGEAVIIKTLADAKCED